MDSQCKLPKQPRKGITHQTAAVGQKAEDLATSLVNLVNGLDGV
jgi:hypothetical protein